MYLQKWNSFLKDNLLLGMDCQAADVWEDFDDSGMGGCVITCDFPAPSFSANNSEGEGSTSMKYTNPTTDPVTPINASSVSKRVFIDCQHIFTILALLWKVSNVNYILFVV